MTRLYKLFCINVLQRQTKQRMGFYGCIPDYNPEIFTLTIRFNQIIRVIIAHSGVWYKFQEELPVYALHKSEIFADSQVLDD